MEKIHLQAVCYRQASEESSPVKDYSLKGKCAELLVV